MNKLIYVVDDEPDILELVSIHLKKASFSVKEFSLAQSLMNSLKKQKPDAIILDLMLPDDDGLEICKRLKKDNTFSNIPVIMLTAKGDETDKVLGLELGADDYITKPFSPKELVARVKAVLRRAERPEEKDIIRLGDVLIDSEKFEVKIRGESINLTTTEFRILQILAARPGRVYSRNQLLDKLWGNEKAVLDRTIDVHIKNLRDKLGQSGNRIKNARGIGYKME